VSVRLGDRALVAPAPAPAPRPAPRRGPSGSRRLRLINPADVSPRARRRRSRLAAVGLATFIGLGLFGLVAFHVVLTQNQFRLDALRTQATSEETRYERLRLQVAELESPQHVVAAAQQRLGMVFPPTITYLTPVAPVGPVASTTPSGATSAPPPTGWSAVKPKLTPRP
jgi:cell division protein FtsL